jgi:hypothetical protein
MEALLAAPADDREYAADHQAIIGDSGSDRFLSVVTSSCEALADIDSSCWQTRAMWTSASTQQSCANPSSSS